MSLTRGGRQLLTHCTQHLPAELPAHGAELPKAPRARNVRNLAWLRPAPLSAAPAHPHGSHPSLLLLVPAWPHFLRGIPWIPFTFQRLFGGSAHRRAFIYLSTAGGSSKALRDALPLTPLMLQHPQHPWSMARCCPHQPSTPKPQCRAHIPPPTAPFWSLSASPLRPAAAPRRPHGQLDAVKAYISGKKTGQLKSGEPGANAPRAEVVWGLPRPAREAGGARGLREQREQKSKPGLWGSPERRREN